MADSTRIEERDAAREPAAHGQAGSVDRHAGEHGHAPSSQQYVFIGLILVIITIAEVAIYYVDMHRTTLTIGLLIFMLMKFVLVVAFYMHLKFDSRIFSTFFTGGLVVAVAAFIAVMAMFRAL